MLTVGSLFSGIGGFDLGFERAGFEIKWQVEIDPFCRAVLEKHWPEVTRYFDIRRVKHLERVDIIAGGFPCQPVSVAGKRRGQEDDRWLWPEFARVIRDVRPRYVIVENVPGLLIRGMGDVLGDLAACGFDAEWDCLPAAAFGAPHRRDRVWLIAYPNAHGGRREVSGQSQYGDKPRAFWHQLDGLRAGRQRNGPRMADAAGDRRPGEGERPKARHSDGSRELRLEPSTSWDVEPDVGRVADGVPARLDRLRGLGNSIVPQIAQWIAERIKEAEGII